MSISVDTAAPIRSLSTVLDDLKAGLRGETVSVGQLVETLHERGIAMILLLFAAPMALPLPVPPGINIALATPLLLLTLQQVKGAHTVWLPQKILDRTFPCDKFGGLISSIIPWAKRLELLIKPRMGWATQNGPSRFFGFLGFLMALSVCIPLPLTNTVPSLGISLMAVGYIMRDGLAVLSGALIGMAWITLLAVAILVFGPDAFHIIKDFIKGAMP